MKRLLAVLLTALAATPAAASSSDIVVWSNTAGWMIASDTTFGNTCFLASTFDNGVTLRLGFQPKGSKFPAYLALGNNDWKSIEAGKEYSLQLHMGNKPQWDAPATGMNLSGMPTLIVNFSDISFISEFVRQHTFKAMFNGSLIAHLSLKGSARASQELVNCQEAVDKLGDTKNNQKDPFAVKDAAPSGTDPFAL